MTTPDGFPTPEVPNPPLPQFATPQEEIAFLRTELERADAKAMYYHHQMGRIAASLTEPFIDSLRRDRKTGLLDTVGFVRAVQNARDNTNPMGVAFIDLGGFGEINNNLGHTRGDRAIIDVAARLNQSLDTRGKVPTEIKPHDVREHDILARVGGDEFVALVHLTPGERKDYFEQMKLIKAKLRTGVGTLMDQGENRDLKELGVGSLYIGQTLFYPYATAEGLERLANSSMLRDKWGRKNGKDSDWIDKEQRRLFGA